MYSISQVKYGSLREAFAFTREGFLLLHRTAHVTYADRYTSYQMSNLCFVKPYKFPWSEKTGVKVWKMSPFLDMNSHFFDLIFFITPYASAIV